jgi:hypothetical protein
VRFKDGNRQNCAISNLECVSRIEAAKDNYRTLYGVPESDMTPIRDMPEQGVKVAFVNVANSQIELIEPLGETSPILKFLEKNPLGGQQRDDLAPAPPVLRPAVEQEDRRGLGVAGGGDVPAAAVDAHVEGARARRAVHGHERALREAGRVVDDGRVAQLDARGALDDDARAGREEQRGLDQLELHHHRLVGRVAREVDAGVQELVRERRERGQRDGALVVGDRHRTIYSAARNLTEAGAPQHLVIDLLREAALDTGLPPREVDRQIECGYLAASASKP